MRGLLMMIKFALVVILASSLPPAEAGEAIAKTRGVVQPQNRTSITREDNVWVWNRVENGKSLEVKVRGEVEFNDDYTEVKRISSGGSLEIRDTRDGVRKRLEIEPGQGGELIVSYFIDGRNRPYDSEAKAWFAKVLDEAVTQSGLNAGPRAQKILKDRGTSGLLDEISRLQSDHVKNLYFQELFKSGSLDTRAAVRASGIVAREMSSDHYKAEVLGGMPEQVLRDETVRTAFLEASGTIKSDHYRAQIISAGLKSGNPSKDSLLHALKGVRGIDSDHYKTQVLLKVAETNL